MLPIRLFVDDAKKQSAKGFPTSDMARGEPGAVMPIGLQKDSSGR